MFIYRIIYSFNKMLAFYTDRVDVFKTAEPVEYLFFFFSEKVIPTF